MELELSHLIDALPGLVWTALPDGRAEFINQRWSDYTGLSREQASGHGWLCTIHPDDLDRFIERWRSFLESGRPGQVETRLRRYDGAYRRFTFSAAPLADESGQVVKWCGINTDIEDHRLASESELKRAHEHLTEAQRLSQTGSFTWDVLADEHSWSAEIRRIFGLDPKVKVTMPMIQSTIHPEDMPAVEAVIGRAVQGMDFDLVFRILRANGEVRHAHVVGHRNQQITDRPVFLGAIQDITGRRMAEEALNAARSELAHVARVMSLGALTASIAHEVNQPLSGIITNASTGLRMLAADPPNIEGARVTMQRTLRDGNRASEVIQRLRSLFTHGLRRVEPVDLNDAAREVLTLSSSELQRSRVVLMKDFDDGLPPVNGDRVQLQQVILNLVLNAADAMRGVEDRPRNLLVATAREATSQVRLSVRDSGVGVDPTSVEKLFDAFYTTKDYGMGIGLAVSRSIIESHAGRLWATANDGPGATFSFSIPCEYSSQ